MRLKSRIYVTILCSAISHINVQVDPIERMNINFALEAYD